jgi:hypothetical protein
VAAHLILKRAAASRPTSEWNDGDYDVLLATFRCDASTGSLSEG